MSSRLSRAVAAVAVAGLLAACNGGSEPEVGASSTVAPAADPTPSETPSPTPSPTPTERDILEDPENDAREPEDGLVGIYRFRDALFTAPDPEKLTLAYAEDCTCYETLYDGLADMAEGGRRVELLGERVIADVTVTERSGPAAVVEFTMDIPAVRVVGPDGEVVAEQEAEPEMVRHEATIVLRGGRWILADVRELG